MQSAPAHSASRITHAPFGSIASSPAHAPQAGITLTVLNRGTDIMTVLGGHVDTSQSA